MTRVQPVARRLRRELRSDAARNREELLRAATVAVHREGPSVPMAVIAAEAGVGIGTLYRHFADRETLLAELTHRSFEQVLVNAVTAEVRGSDPLDSIRLFADAAIRQRRELVLPLHRGPDVVHPATLRTRERIHEIVVGIVERGKSEGSIRMDVTASDVIAFGAMLSQPMPRSAPWDATCRRLLETFLRGLEP